MKDVDLIFPTDTLVYIVSKAKILLRFFYLIVTRKLEVIWTIT